MHGLLEKFMPTFAVVTDEQYETFIRKGINTSYGQKLLAEIASDTGASAVQQTAATATPTAANTTPKFTQVLKRNAYQKDSEKKYDTKYQL